MKKSIYVLLSLLLTSCVTGAPQKSETIEKRPAPAEVPSPPQVELIEGYGANDNFYNNGIVTFSGENSLWEVASGLHDEDVKGVEILVEWHMVEPEEEQYDWSVIDDAIKLWGSYGKTIDIRMVSANQNTHITPEWLFDRYKVRRIAAGQEYDFEKKGLYEIPRAGERTKGPEKLIAGLRSLNSARKGDFFISGAEQLQPGKVYGIQFDYKAFSDGEMTIEARTIEGGSDAVKRFTWSFQEGEEALQSWTVELDSHRDYSFVLINEGGEISVDNLAIQEITRDHRGNVGFPDYFNPVFQEKWSRLITAMGERYNDHPVVDRVIITGFGRWGELNLEGVNVGRRDNQWLWIGWNEERYMDHVEWAMNLYKEHFPDKKLRMVAGGFSIASMTDQDFLYWRAIHLCAKYGVEMKLNGMQEGFGIWKQNMFSYGSHRYKHNDDMGIVLETAGQIYRNITGAEGIPTGHPLTLLNRCLIDGTDTLYLYGPDILSRNVKKYFPYMTEQLGAEVFTKLYNHHGAYNFINETEKEAPIRYKDMWLGIYHTKYKHSPGNTDRYPVAYPVIDGEKAISTTEEDRSGLLEYDIDARLRYSGMYGAVIHVSYLDRGTDSLAFRIYDGYRNEVELGTVRKTGTDQWKLASFYVSDYIQSWRNSGEDDHVIFTIDDRKDGIETVRYIEMDYVPAMEWNTYVIDESPAQDRYTEITGTESFDITFEGEGSPAFLVLPFWTVEDTLAKKSVQFKIYSSLEGKEKLISHKEYAFGMDGDEVYLPLTGAGNSIRVEMAVEMNKAGLYLNDKDQLAWKVLGYTGTDESAYSGAASLFALNSPSESVKINGSAPSEAPMLLKKLPTDQWIEVEKTQIREKESASYTVTFTPQPQGIYALSGVNGSSPITPVNLDRLTTPKPALDRKSDDLIWQWPANELKRTGKVEGSRPELIAGNVGVRAGQNQNIEFSMINKTAASLARVYWSRDGEDFSAERSVWIPVIPNDPTLRDYRYNIGEHPLWDGVIDRIKIEPLSALVQAGEYRIERAVLTDPEELYTFTFSGPGDRFFQYNQIDTLTFNDGYLEVSNSFPVISSMPNSPGIWAEEGQLIEIRLQNLSDSIELELGWQSEVPDTVAESHEYINGYEIAELIPKSEDWQTIILDPSANPKWKGYITALDLSFFNEEKEPIRIDYITIRRK